MAPISTADFKNGMGLKINDKYYTIVEFQHVKPGKGGAFVRYKIRDLKTGRVIDQTCNAGTKFENVQLITKEMQYLYNDGGTFYFMDNETYEQVALPADFIGDNAKWFKENDNAQLLYADTELLGVEPPMFIEVEITETDPGFKGDPVQGGATPATVPATSKIPPKPNTVFTINRYSDAAAPSRFPCNALFKKFFGSPRLENTLEMPSRTGLGTAERYPRATGSITYSSTVSLKAAVFRLSFSHGSSGFSPAPGGIWAHPTRKAAAQSTRILLRCFVIVICPIRPFRPIDTRTVR